MKGSSNLNINNLNEILKERDKYQIHTHQWNELNALKNHALSKLKPSTNEIILYFDETDLGELPEGFSENRQLKAFTEPQEFASRFTLEYNSGLTRHPIPYLILKYKNKYFYILREKGSGELRLIGKLGMVGGHVGIEDKKSNAKLTIEQGLLRELEEEVGVKLQHIKTIVSKGYIKSNNGVDQDHLGLVYEIELGTDNIKAEEDGVLSGIWIDESDLHGYYDKMENWAKIVYDNILKGN